MLFTNLLIIILLFIAFVACKPAAPQTTVIVDAVQPEPEH
jgi:hypothetical protein